MIKLNTALKHIALTLCLVVAFPSILSLQHALDQHDHKSCENPTAVHFHEKQIDCSLYKFQLSPIIAVTPVDFEVNDIVVYQTASFNSTSIQVERSLALWHLRGPPSDSLS